MGELIDETNTIQQSNRAGQALTPEQERTLHEFYVGTGISPENIATLRRDDPDALIFLGPGSIRFRSRTGHFDFSSGDYIMVVCDRDASHSHPRFHNGCRQCKAREKASHDPAVVQAAKKWRGDWSGSRASASA